MTDPKVHRFTRQELYDRVWAEPKRTIAAALGISDVALAKACKKADIPVPDRGYWAKRQAGKPTVKRPLPPRFPGASNHVQIGGGSWYSHGLSDQEILAQPIPPPPTFDEDLETLRTRVVKMVGKVAFPTLASQTHPLIRKLLDQDEEATRRLEQDDYFWDKPRFGSPLEKRRLRLLNAVFLGMQRLGCRPDMSTSKYADNYQDVSVRVGDQHVHLKLEKIVPSRRARNKKPPEKERLRFSIPSSHGKSEVVQSWEDTDGAKLNKALTDIVIELIMAGERAYRRNVERRHKRRIERKAELEEKERQRRLEAERKARELREQRERERIERLLAQASALQQAETIRRYVAAIRERYQEEYALHDKVEHWARWALAQADRIDPTTTHNFLQQIDDD